MSAQGSLVVIALRNSPEHMVAAIAAWKLGSCVVPLRWDLPGWERDRLLEVAKPSAVVADWKDLDEPTVSTAELFQARSMSPIALADRVPEPAFGIATAGSTGSPKLIISPGPGIYDPGRANASAESIRSGPGQVQLVPAPLYHANGFRISHAALHRDEQLVLMEAFDAERAAGLIERHRVTTVTMAPPCSSGSHG